MLGAAVTAMWCIAKALSLAQHGVYDGAHHKNWVIDQMVRALLGCPEEERHGVSSDPARTPYTYTAQGTNSAYERFVRDNPGWDEGVAP